MEKWSGKFAVFTGASAGIGEAIVKDFARAGINVIALARRSEKVEEFVKTLGDTPGKVYAYKCDVSKVESVKEAFKWIEEKFGSISILINNAGIAVKLNILDEGDDVTEKINSLIATNMTGLVHCTREAVRLIKKSDDYGLIVNVNSILGHSLPFYESSANVYPASKFAVTAISEVVRQELVLQGSEKIRVSSLSPGMVSTDIVVAAGYTENRSEFYSTIPHLSVENVAQAVRFLLETPYNVNISELTIKPVGERV